MSRWSREVALTAEDLEDCVALAISITFTAKELWVETRDERLRAIAQDAEAIREKAKAVRMRHFGQGNLFGTGEEEPSRSMGPGHRRE